jgi:hypothetical protein
MRALAMTTTSIQRCALFAASALLIAACIATRAARADDTPPMVIADASASMSKQLQSMPQLIISLLSAVETIAKYEAPAAFPQVRQVTRTELEREACGGQRCRFVKAAYVPEKGLYLENVLDPQASVMDRSILLHELVHHLQASTQRYAHLAECERRREEEREAFAVQNAYLAQSGGGKYVPFPERMYRCGPAQS